jgi:ribonuclease HII
MLSHHTKHLMEAGCDEAGRGCLAGPVFAAAVILPSDYHHPLLTDSKQLDKDTRDQLRRTIEAEALHFAVAYCTPQEIDKINILWASVRAMHKALEMLPVQPDQILVDGNHFKAFRHIPHHCIIKGDATYFSIAAASILAKTYRDEYMEQLHHELPQYHWHENKGYPTPAHRKAIEAFGPTIHHRKSFRLLPENTQTLLFDDY